jgi:hypothetical protein
MAKLTKFKAQQVEFGTHYKIEETNRGDTKIKSITPAFGNIRELGTPETEEIYNGLQLGNVHTLQAIKSTNLNIDYYICNLDGLTEFGLNNDLKLRITVDNANTNTTTKLRLNNVDYTLLKEHNGTLKQIEAGDFKPNKSYELVFNGSQFIVTNITEYGTTAGTSLEGNRLAEIIGLEFGGNIQDTGNKVKGKFYFDNVTKFYYECIENTNLTYNDATKFRAVSNKPLSDKVESLSEVKEYVFAINGLTNGKIVKIGKLAHLTIDSGTHFYNKGADAVVLNIPQGFRPRNLVNFSAVNLSNVPNSFRIAANGNVIKVFSDSKNGAYYFSVTYFTD